MGKSMIGSVTASVVSAHTGVECDREFTASVSAHTKWKKKWLHAQRLGYTSIVTLLALNMPHSGRRIVKL